MSTRSGHVRAALLVGSVVAGMLTFASPSVGADVPRPFTASAAANGVRGVVTIVGGPGTDVPFDGGGPTAQVSASSIGDSRGYAALPDVGEFLVTVPGLIVGLLAAGTAGLPPTQIPSLPEYPLYVTSDRTVQPDVAVGEGPYRLRANSSEAATTAEATAGLQADSVGDAALVRSLSSVVLNDETVTTTAVTEVQGLTIGPLSLGIVRSTARATMGPDGDIDFDSSLQLEAVRIGGLPVAVGPDGISVLGVPVDLPIRKTVEELLSSSGMVLEFLPEQQFDDRVIAGALRLTVPFEMPAPVPPLGQPSGSVTLTLGSATVAMTAAAPGAPLSTDGSEDTSEPAGLPPSRAPLTNPGTAIGALPSGEGQASSSPTALTAPVASGGPLVGPLDLWDIGPVYLTFAAGCVGMVGAGQLVRRRGVRGPWTS